MDEKEFALRLAKLRQQHGVSARDMSLSMGQNHGYINSIELGKIMPSMTGFFYICEYLNITPVEFFDTDAENPEQLAAIIQNLKKLNGQHLASIADIVQGLAGK